MADLTPRRRPVSGPDDADGEIKRRRLEIRLRELELQRDRNDLAILEQEAASAALDREITDIRAQLDGLAEGGAD